MVDIKDGHSKIYSLVGNQRSYIHWEGKGIEAGFPLEGKWEEIRWWFRAQLIQRVTVMGKKGHRLKASWAEEVADS